MFGYYVALITLAVMLVAVAAYHISREIQWDRERRSLVDRIHAGSLDAYNDHVDRSVQRAIALEVPEEVEEPMHMHPDDLTDLGNNVEKGVIGFLG